VAAPHCYRYPTACRLVDGRVLITGAYSAYGTDACVGVACLNPQMNTFDPDLLDAGRDPYAVLLDRWVVTQWAALDREMIVWPRPYAPSPT